MIEPITNKNEYNVYSIMCGSLSADRQASDK